MIYYPIFLDVQGKPVLLVGGGHVADEKLGKLVDHGADVTIVAPDLIPEVRAFVDAGRARWERREFRDGDTAGYFLVMVATDNGAVNRRVADEARARQILVNAADDADNCDFILPSLVRRGDIALAASTGGSSPAMARWLRERLEEFLSDDVLALADLLADVRREIRAGDRECARRCTLAETPPPLLCRECPNRIPSDRWQEAIDAELMALINLGDMQAAKERLVASLGRTELTPSPTWREEVVVITFAGMSHQTAPLGVRERVAIDDEALAGVLRRAKEAFGAATIINTCNRLELYLPGIHEPEAALSFLALALDVDHDTIERYFNVAYGADAVRHLYAVASGIDSMVLGETEVLGQVRQAFSSTVAAGADNAMLSRLFHTAIRTGRRARNETSIGERSVSVSSIAAQQARDLFDLAKANVLVVGAGEAGRLAAEAVVAYGAERVTVTNRTFERAEALASALGGTAIPFAGAIEALRTADVVIAASGAPDALFEDAAVGEATTHRDGLPLLIIDIGVPRDFHPTVREVKGVAYYDLDDLQEVAARNTEARASEVAAVQAIVDEETARFVEWWSQLQIVPTISAITDRAETIRRNEIAKTLRRLRLAEDDRAHVEELTDVLTRALVRQLLHAPLATLRERGDQDTYLNTARTLFRLDEPVEDA